MAFTTLKGLFKPTVMFFGLMNLPVIRRLENQRYLLGDAKFKSGQITRIWNIL